MEGCICTTVSIRNYDRFCREAHLGDAVSELAYTMSNKGMK